MGRNHVRVLTELGDVDLVGVADSSEASLDAALRGRTTPRYTDVVRMIEERRPEFVVVATPTVLHAEMAEVALSRGIHCLVEKPIAATRDEAERMSKLAEANGVHLGIGHVERYNPAILQLRDRLTRGEGGEVHLLTARRTGPFPARVRDVGVITDLATHDVDIMMMLTLSSVERVYAETAKRIHRTHEDLFCGTLRFEDGQIGMLDINWLTPFKTRELSVVCERGAFVANYLTQELTFYENADATSGWDSLAQLTGVAEGNMTRYQVARVEPLRAEIQAFTEAIRGEGYRYVTAENGLATLDVTTALLLAAETKQTIKLAAAGVV
jgi:UDP-N-acetylglucosamine 3-dehydrogenase